MNSLLSKPLSFLFRPFHLCALASLFFSIALIQAGEVKTKLKETDALAVSEDYNRFAKDNVTVRVEATTKNINYDRAGEKGYKVEVLGNKGNACTVEFYSYVSPKNIPSAVLVAGRGDCREAIDSFDFTIGRGFKPKERGGWFVRVVRDGHIIGVAGSTPKYEEMAGNASTQISYGVTSSKQLAAGGR